MEDIKKKCNWRGQKCAWNWDWEGGQKITCNWVWDWKILSWQKDKEDPEDSTEEVLSEKKEVKEEYQLDNTETIEKESSIEDGAKENEHIIETEEKEKIALWQKKNIQQLWIRQEKKNLLSKQKKKNKQLTLRQQKIIHPSLKKFNL